MNWQQGGSSGPPSVAMSDDGQTSDRSLETSFRVLISGRKVGSVIGRGGVVIQQLRDATGARLKIADPTPGDDERVMTISAKDSRAAQEALFRVYQCLVEGSNQEGEEAAQHAHDATTIRLLVSGSQAGSLIGRGGEVIQVFRDQSGASVRVLPPEEVPPSAMPGERVAQLSGEPTAVRKALQMVSETLIANPPKLMQPAAYGNQGFGGGGRPRASAPAAQYPPGQTSWAGGNAVVSHVRIHNGLIGSVIGRGGQNIAQVREISGASVKIHDRVDGIEDRVIEIVGSSEQVAAATALLEAAIVNSQGFPMVQ